MDCALAEGWYGTRLGRSMQGGNARNAISNGRVHTGGGAIAAKGAKAVGGIDASCALMVVLSRCAVNRLSTTRGRARPVGPDLRRSEMER